MRERPACIHYVFVSLNPARRQLRNEVARSGVQRTTSRQHANTIYGDSDSHAHLPSGPFHHTDGLLKEGDGRVQTSPYAVRPGTLQNRHHADRRIFVTQSFHGGEPPAIPAVPAPVSLSQLKRPVTNWNTRERNDDMAFRVYPWPPVNMYREFHNRCSRTLSQLKDPSRTQP